MRYLSPIQKFTAHIKYGSGGERVALAEGDASGSRLNRFHRRLISPTNSPPQIKYGSGGERVALAAGDASGSRLNRFHRRLISLTNSPHPFSQFTLL
ncbi:MAG: hypothetical protein RSD12_09530, partial [Akkermansia sp.]